MLLERLLDNLGLSVEVFATCGVAPGWRLRLPALDWVTLHFVVHGEGALRLGGGAVRQLRCHSLAIVPPHLQHALECGTGALAESPGDDGASGGANVPAHVAGPADRAGLVVVCGRFQAIYGGGLGLFDRLQDEIILDFGDSPQMRGTFDALREEQRRPRPGGHAMMVALVNQCLVLLLRRLCRDPQCSLPWLKALEDPRLSRVLDVILARPEQPHRLTSLADIAHMSRSAFAHQFHTAFGRTPMDYVREVRLRRGASLLRRNELSVDAVAARVGFASRSQFSRAFRQLFGRSPAEFRTGSV